MGMISFFDKVRERSENQGIRGLEETLSFLNTHPATIERIRRLQKRHDNGNEALFYNFAMDFRGFQDLIRHTQKRKEQD